MTFAKNRLLIQDLLTRHPEIHDVKIKAPIIVAGLPRSGTTHLLNLLAADSRLRSLPLWESYEPVPTPGEEAAKLVKTRDMKDVMPSGKLCNKLARLWQRCIR